MTFRELFDRYRAGDATEEERRIVDEELEKTAIINDYLFGTWEEAPPEAPAGELRQVKRTLRKRNLLLVLTSLLLAAALLVGTLKIAIPQLEGQYFDPTQATWSEEKTDLELALECYYILFSHRQHFTGVEPARDTGFASWELELSYVDGDEDGDHIYRTVTTNRNDIHFARDTLSFILPDFFQPHVVYSLLPSSVESFRESFPDHLANVEDGDRILAAISFSKDLTPAELMELSRSFNGLFHWVGVRINDGLPRTEPLIGVHLDQGREDCGVNAAYPDLECGLPNEDNLESHFRSLVTYCRDYQKNVIDIGIVEDPDYFDKVLSYLDENGISFYGCYASGDAESFLWLSENGYIAEYHPIEIRRPSEYHYDIPTFGG